MAAVLMPTAAGHQVQCWNVWVVECVLCQQDSDGSCVNTVLQHCRQIHAWSAACAELRLWLIVDLCSLE